ncbi:MAG: 4-hydroxy-tetrahydrodipicolinate synthase [Patescibacteria group bacterium]
MKQLTGAITALVTPFDKKGNVDVPTLQKLVAFQIKEGINGIVACGSTGEAATLSFEEYSLVIKTVVDTVAGRIPVIAGAVSNDTHKSIHLSQLAKKSGADILLHVNPYYNKPTPAGLLAHYKAIAATVDLPFLLYNVPGRTGSNMTAATTLRIAQEIPQVIGIKESSANLPQMMEIIRSAPKNFSLLSGDDNFTLPIIAIGGMGAISVVANETPKAFTQLVQHALAGEWEKAKKMHYQLLDLMDVNFIETNPQPVKTALALMGKVEEVFRLPLVQMEKKNKEELKKVLKNMELI